MNMPGSPNTSNKSISTVVYKSEKRLKWHLGIRANSRPEDIIKELCKVLVNLDYEWQIITPYSLKCRPKHNHEGKIKLGLQLYVLEVRVYIVDFKCILPSESELRANQTSRENGDLSCQPFIIDFLERSYSIIKALPQ